MGKTENEELALILGGVLGGVAGYALGNTQTPKQHPLIAGADKKFEIIKAMKVVIPFRLFRAVPSAKSIYKQAVKCYLFGLPDASVPMSVRVMEIALRKRYAELEKHPKEKIDLFELIDWAAGIPKNDRSPTRARTPIPPQRPVFTFETEASENTSGLIGNADALPSYFPLIKKDTADWLRHARNKLHSEELVEDADAIEILRHSSDLVSQLYPITIPIPNAFRWTCLTCGQAKGYEITKELAYVGNEVIHCCPVSSKQVSVHIFPNI